MQNLSSNIRISVTESVFLKDPETSEIGRNIISKGIDLLVELGYEQFTFKKLATKIQTTEASIYRYFESKHMLLTYLIHWYWGWQEYRLVIHLSNVECPTERIKKAIKVFAQSEFVGDESSLFNLKNLQELVITDSTKLYLTKDVDAENQAGYFAPYKRIVNRLSQIVLEINPTYRYPHMLISTMIEGINHQRYFTQHLPRLTDIIPGEDAVTLFYEEMILKLVTPSK